MKLLGHGIDILNLNRKELADYQLAKRFMTPAEYKIGLNLSPKRQHTYVCAIWALKEAIIKATNQTYLFSEIEIQLTGRAPVCNLPKHKLMLSLSYERDFVIASAIAYTE